MAYVDGGRMTAYTVLTIIEFNIVTIVSCVGSIRRCWKFILEKMSKVTLSGVRVGQVSHGQWYGK
ncbi:hypothetical protein N7471_010557 [Penicillium samsonianum]|uniref:uncharacterized protein n=1 Tax=Penicillium samsonianum TaxID=1882272 RepID=UPI00254977C9|nr:uncharacterized protein N7471_010557 [Penicillium samsonianum]KAJ6126064.1 hypothetical protein N7471_010557 [Penicillium samsonianum]